MVTCEDLTCGNEGVCIEGQNVGDRATCDCSETGYIGSTCEISLVAIIALPVAASVTLGVYFLLRKVHPKANNAVVLTATLALYDFITDCTFMLSQAKTGINSPIFISALVFLILPVLFNLFVAGNIFISSVWHNPEMDKWVKENFTTAAAVAILASTNIEMFLLLNSGLFNLDTFRAPLDEKALKTIAVAGLLGSLLEDIPQLVIQSISASNVLDTITFLSIIASILTIFFGVFKKGLMFAVGKFGASSRTNRYQQQQGEDLYGLGEEGGGGEEGHMSTLYSEYPEEKR